LVSIQGPEELVEWKVMFGVKNMMFYVGDDGKYELYVTVQQITRAGRNVTFFQNFLHSLLLFSHTKENSFGGPSTFFVILAHLVFLLLL
jgi:hypothetical protein